VLVVNYRDNDCHASEYYVDKIRRCREYGDGHHGGRGVIATTVVNTMVRKVVVNTADVNTIVVYMVVVYTAVVYTVMVDTVAVDTPVFN